MQGVWSPLLIASQHGHLAIVKLLVAAKARVNAQNGPHGATALYIAAFHGRTECARVLLKNGADLKAVDKVRAYNNLLMQTFVLNLYVVRSIIIYLHASSFLVHVN